MIALPRIIAHRGASAYAPENTMAAFKKAVTMGASMIEFDVGLSLDGQAFVLHDDDLARTTNGRGALDKASSADIKQLDAGRWFAPDFAKEPVPSLQQVVLWLVESGVDANIEIKDSGDVEQTAVAVLSVLNSCWPYERGFPLVSSFSEQALSAYRKLAPEAPIGFLMHNWREDWEETAKKIACQSIHIHASQVTAKRVRAIREKGYLVCVYTINRKSAAQRLFKLGVDAVFSDYPDLLS